MMQHRRSVSPPERGAALTATLALLALLALWGVATVITSPGETRTAENYRQIAQYHIAHAQVFYAAEAGLAEARARLRTEAGPHRIIDTAPDDPRWGVAIGTPGEVLEAGNKLHSYARVASLQNDLPYTVTIRHATRAADTAVLRWGDDRGTGVSSRNTTHGENIYVITAHGVLGEARHTVEIEAALEPPPTMPAALYVAGPLHMPSTHTHIMGTDGCGEQPQAGVRTALPSIVMTPPDDTTITGVPPVAYRSVALHVQTMVNTFKEYATIVYESTASARTTPHPGKHWGTPMLATTMQTPSTCKERHIVYYDTHGSQGHFGAGTTGCGLLLVEGDVKIDGDFSWYGAMLVTGALQLTGGGMKQVTGGLAVAGSMTIDEGVETSLVYCSEAIAQQTRSLPLRILTWRDVFPTTN